MKRAVGLLGVCLLVGLGVSEARAGVADRFWLEIWGDLAYRNTNFGLEAPFWDPGYRERDIVLTRGTAKAGLRFGVTEGLHLDPYLKLEAVGDWGNDPWNDVYWNNHEKWGPGVRLRAEHVDPVGGSRFVWFNNVTVDGFVELLTIEDALDGAKDEVAEHVPSHNVRAGLSAWVSVISRRFLSDRLSLWGEMWGELAYESTNFYEEDKEDFYLLTLQPKAGLKWHLGRIVSLQPYYTLDLKRDLADEAWNREPWINAMQHGPGVRLAFGDIPGMKNASVYLYAEDLSIDHFSRVPESSYEHLAESDYRVGITFWLPFGATRESIVRP
jgi:hypothetical protein